MNICHGHIMGINLPFWWVRCIRSCVCIFVRVCMRACVRLCLCLRRCLCGSAWSLSFALCVLSCVRWGVGSLAIVPTIAARDRLRNRISTSALSCSAKMPSAPIQANSIAATTMLVIFRSWARTHGRGVLKCPCARHPSSAAHLEHH